MVESGGCLNHLLLLLLLLDKVLSSGRVSREKREKEETRLEKRERERETRSLPRSSPLEEMRKEDE